MPSVPSLREPNANPQYQAAMRKVQRAIRRNDMADARTWLEIAERCMRLRSAHADIVLKDDKQSIARALLHYQLLALEIRARKYRRGVLDLEEAEEFGL